LIDTCLPGYSYDRILTAMIYLPDLFIYLDAYADSALSLSLFPPNLASLSCYPTLLSIAPF